MRRRGLAEAIAPGLSCLINFGGDVAVAQCAPRWQALARRHRELRSDRYGRARRATARGALATSGDSRRFVFRDGHRYSHILDARTGWPVRNAPHSITVAADTCTQAGTLTTLAMLQGERRREHAEGERRAVLAAVAACDACHILQPAEFVDITGANVLIALHTYYRCELCWTCSTTSLVTCASTRNETASPTALHLCGSPWLTCSSG